MHKKSFFKRLFIGIAVMGMVVTIISTYLWPCSASMQCPKGHIIWCETFGTCLDEQCTEHEEGYVVCICSTGTYMIVKCDLTVKTPRPPIT